MNNTSPPVSKEEATQSVKDIRSFQSAARKRNLAPLWWTILMALLAGLVTALTVLGVSRWYLVPFPILVFGMVVAQSRKAGVMPRFGWRQLLVIVALSAGFSLLIYAAQTLGADNLTAVSIIVAGFIILMVYIVSLIERHFYASK